MNMTNNLDYLLFNYDACERGLFKNIMTLKKRIYSKITSTKKCNSSMIFVNYILTFSSHTKTHFDNIMT